jgi:hypothetical protein
MTKIKRNIRTVLSLSMVAAVLGITYGVQQYQSAQQIKKLHQLATQEYHLDARTKTSNCKIANAMPDHSCTPGASFPNVTKEQVCKSGYSASVRNVPQSEKNQVYAEYGIATHTTGQYEVDHHISLELGGSNDIGNLWPEAAQPVPGFHEKDKVENFLHDKLCSGKISLTESQDLISNHWLQVYQLIQK